MSKRLIYVMTFVLALSGTANAAVYLWNGSAADGLWETPANWAVTDSTWTWPNEENAADPNFAAYVNSDVLGIDIIDGSAVDRADTLRIKGADELTTAVLTLDNASSLTVSGRLSIGTDPDGAPRMGELNVLNGSILTILDGANGNDLYAADDPNTVGTINIVDSFVDVFDDIVIDEGEGTINISNSTITADDIKVADSATGVCTLNVSGATTITLVDDLIIDEGEGYINVSGSSTIDCDDFQMSGNATGLSFVDISGTTTITIADDFDLDNGVSTVTIGGDAVISFGDDGYVPDDDNAVATLTITDNAVFNVGDDITVADNAGSVGHMIITGNATVNAPDEFYLADDPTAFATLDVNGTATLNVGDDLDVGEDGAAICNIGENATVIVGDTIYIPHHQQGIEAGMTISGNATVTCDDLQVVNDGGNTGFLHISGNPTITMNVFYMNNDAGDPATSEVIMDGGTVTVTGDATFNDDNNGTATFTLNGGSFYSGDDISVSDNIDGTAHLTINGGEMIAADDLKLGDSGGEDTGQVRVFMNGGLLQAEDLPDIKITDTQIIYTGGVFRIGADDLDVAGMQQLVDDGTIVIEEGLVHSIVSNGIYTELNPLSPSLPQMPNPVDGAEGVPLGSSLNWAPGATAATNDVYFGTTNPPAFAASVEAATYYPGPLAPGTTYYWQVDAVEADGTTKHSSEVWSFTATTETDVAVEVTIAAGSDDAEEDVGGGSDFDIDLTSSDLELMHDNDPADPNDEQVVGLRFADVGIPAGAVITSASVQFDADDVDDSEHVGNAYILIDGELNPDPGTFEDVLNNITARPRTAAQVPWTSEPWPSDGGTHQKALTPDISGIIQEIVDQDGWAAGNALALILSQDPANPSEGHRECESYNGAGGNADQRPMLSITAVVSVASQPSPADGAEGVPLDATLGWWPGINAVSHNVYFATSAAASLAAPPTYLVDGDSQNLPWVVADGTISFDGQLFDNGGDPEFIAAGASGNTLDVPDDRNWAKLSFDFDVDSVQFVYGGNIGNITVEAKDNVGALIDSLYQADTYDGQPAGPVTFSGLDITFSGSGIRTLNWKDTSTLPQAAHNAFAALDNVILTTVPPAFLGNTTQVSFDPGVLAPSTTYYWQVDTIEADGTIHTGAVWSFTTELGEASQPDPADKAVGVALDKILSWKPGATVATHDVYFGTTSPPPFIGNQTDPNFDPGPLEMETTYYWQVDEIDADGMTVYTGDVWSFKTPRPGTGTILREVWEGITGTSVSDLTGSADYPYNPTYSEEVTLFETPTDFADNFGSRVHGYLHPDTSGDYTFWIATDDNSELLLSTDEDPANAVVIASEDSWTGSRSWQEGNEKSGPISLEGGQKYYIMALYKEGGGGDNCAVAWEGPDSPARAVIVGYYLSPYVEFKATSPDPADGTIEVQKTVTLSWAPGGTAASHDVYLSADQQAVIDGTAFASIETEASYSPPGLEKGITYYWRVDEVEADGTTTYTGDVWSFTVTTLGR